MKREIKFRGLDKQGKWHYGYYAKDYIGDAYITSIDGTYAVIVIPESVGQYTGLKDKEGKEIYEGDVILVANYRMYSNKSKIVQWDNDLSCYVFKATGVQSTRICLATETEIIGNIHEPKTK